MYLYICMLTKLSLIISGYGRVYFEPVDCYGWSLLVLFDILFTHEQLAVCLSLLLVYTMVLLVKVEVFNGGDSINPIILHMTWAMQDRMICNKAFTGCGNSFLVAYSVTLRLWFLQISVLDFSRDRKMMSVLCSRKQKQILFSKGAPESIISRCTNVLCNENDHTVPLTADIRADLESRFCRLD